MIGELKPYSEYRDAEGGWLGRAPAHWRVRRLKYLLRERDTRSTSGKEQLLRVSQYTGVTKRQRADGLEEPDTRAESLVGYKVVQPQDLVINIMLAWNGSMGVSLYDGIASPAYCVYRFADEAHPWFYHNLLRCPIYKQRIKAMSTGVVESRLRLYSDDLFRIEALLPPPEEQAVIVRFLDHANGRLERAIRAKRKVIALLNEQKQAIIHRAVTRGLNPDAPLKPSGIPWLGTIPAHWELRPLKYVCSRIQNGATPPSDEPKYYENGTVPWYGPGSLGPKIDVGESSRLVALTAVRDGKIRLIKGPALLITVIGTVGKMALMRSDGATNQQITAFEIRENIAVPDFLTIQLKFAESWLAAAASSSTIPILDSGVLARAAIALPSIAEQENLVCEINRLTSPFDTAILRLEREIALLREYRTRLVADVVTGQLDVRPTASRLPAEAELPIAAAAEPAVEAAPEETELD